MPIADGAVLQVITFLLMAFSCCGLLLSVFLDNYASFLYSSYINYINAPMNINLYHGHHQKLFLQRNSLRVQVYQLQRSLYQPVILLVRVHGLLLQQMVRSILDILMLYRH